MAAHSARPGDVTRRGEDPADQQGRIDCTQTAAVAQQRIESVAHGFQHREAGSRGHSDDDPTLRGARIGDSQDDQGHDEFCRLLNEAYQQQHGISEYSGCDRFADGCHEDSHDTADQGSHQDDPGGQQLAAGPVRCPQQHGQRHRERSDQEQRREQSRILGQHEDEQECEIGDDAADKHTHRNEPGLAR